MPRHAICRFTNEINVELIGTWLERTHLKPQKVVSIEIATVWSARFPMGIEGQIISYLGLAQLVPFLQENKMISEMTRGNDTMNKAVTILRRKKSCVGAWK